MTTSSGARPEPGRFISLEGPEGAGKTFQAERLRASLAASGREVVLTREPGGTAVGERIRALLLDGSGELGLRPMTDALLFNAARAQLVAEVVEPALARGAIVIATRFSDSTLAYQGYGAGLPLEDLRAIEQAATGGRRPDLTILLDLPPEVGLSRKHPTEISRFEAEFDLAFHRRVRDGFLALAAAEPARFAVVEAAGPPAVVEQAILDAVAGVLRIGQLSPAGPVAATPGEPPGASERHQPVNEPPELPS